MSIDTAPVRRTPEAMNWSSENCTLERAAEILGDRWSLLIVREVSLGVRRFDDIQVRTSMPRQVLSSRLSGLVDEGILCRHPYREEGQRERFEYRFTDKGIAFIPVIVALLDWGNAYLADTDGAPLEIYHDGCDAHVHAALVCDDGHVLDDARGARTRRGPGARPRTAAVVSAPSSAGTSARRGSRTRR